VQAWIDADHKLVWEIKKVQDVLLPEISKKTCRQPFHVEATKLNFKACPTEGYSEVPRTKMLDYAFTYIVRIHHSDDKLHAMEGTPRLPLLVLLHHPSLPNRSSYLFHIIM
jgi:hypothetical protein